jgi:hypothetical protein
MQIFTTPTVIPEIPHVLTSGRQAVHPCSPMEEPNNLTKNIADLKKLVCVDVAKKSRVKAKVCGIQILTRHAVRGACSTQKKFYFFKISKYLLQKHASCTT